MEIISKIYEILTNHIFAIIIYITAISFAILHLCSTYVIDSITIILIIIALIPFLAFYVDSIKAFGFRIQMKAIENLYNATVNEAKKDPSLVPIFEKSSDDIILDILSLINSQLELLCKANDISIGLSQTKILDKLVNSKKLLPDDAKVINDAIYLLKRATKMKDIGSISAKVVITVGLKALESLKAIPKKIENTSSIN